MPRLVLLGVCCAVLGSTMPSRAQSTAPEPLHAWTLAERTWIWSRPAKSGRRLGHLRGGQAVILRQDAAVAGPGCPEGFLAIEPKGYVCGGDRITRDKSHPTLKRLALFAPSNGPMPFSYAISNGAPMYTRLPTEAEWQQAERELGPAGKHEEYPWNRGHERLAEVRAVQPTHPVPKLLEEGGSLVSAARGLVQRHSQLGTLLAYTRAFTFRGRVWLLISDGTIVPADRVRPYRVSRFSGHVLGEAAQLPMALVHERPAAKYVLDGAAGVRQLDSRWQAHARLALDPKRSPAWRQGRRYWATLEHGADEESLWLSDADAGIVASVDKLPHGLRTDEKWIRVSITQGTLVAFEGVRPVFATLISPGRGGVSQPGVDNVQASTTPRGRFRVQYKYRSHTMSPEKDRPRDQRSFWIAEVPSTQFFDIPFALHTSYWHEDFGQWMSGGCVNLSPLDGKWLFDWTLPHVPQAWAGVWSGGDNGPGTTVIVVR